MDLLRKAMPMNLKDVDAKQGIFTGYFSSFGVVDSYNEVVDMGAFAKSFKEWGPQGKNRIKCAYQHDPISMLLGKPLKLEEKSFGAYHETKVSQTSYGKDVLLLIEDGVLTEQSFSFETIQDVPAHKSSDGYRHLVQVRVWEYGPQTWGANPETPITGIKSNDLLNRMRQLDKHLRSGKLHDRDVIRMMTDTMELWSKALGVADIPTTEVIDIRLKAEHGEVFVGDFVEWNSSGGMARGKITQIVTDGDVPDIAVTVTGTEDDPAARIQVYRPEGNGWEASDTFVGHKLSTLTKIDPLPAPTDEEKAEEYEGLDFSIPQGVQDAAKRGLELREEYGRGGTEGGARTARRLSKGGDATPAFVRKVARYFPRHEGDNLDENGSDGNPPSNGYIAWMLWGGDPGRTWSENLVERMDAMDAEREAGEPMDKKAMSYEQLTSRLWDSVRNIERIPYPDGMGDYGRYYLMETYPEYCIVCDQTDGKYYQMTYVMAADGAFSFGSMVEVERTYTPVAEMAKAANILSILAKSYKPLEEKAGRRNNSQDAETLRMVYKMVHGLMDPEDRAKVMTELLGDMGEEEMKMVMSPLNTNQRALVLAALQMESEPGKSHSNDIPEVKQTPGPDTVHPDELHRKRRQRELELLEMESGI